MIWNIRERETVSSCLLDLKIDEEKMSGIVIKEAPEKEIKHPNDDPNRAVTLAAAEKRIKAGQLKFENEADERDYRSRVASNPMNQFGLPAFFPPQVFKSVGFGEGTFNKLLPCGHKEKKFKYIEEHKVQVKIIICEKGCEHREQ